MRKILTILYLLFSTLHAEVINQYPSPEFLNSGITIIDIRTPAEWKETGIIKGAVPLTFFDERGNYDVPAFMKLLKSHVKEDQKFALICHVGSRTALVAKFLDQQYQMKVINLLGGMDFLHKQGYKTVKFEANHSL